MQNNKSCDMGYRRDSRIFFKGKRFCGNYEIVAFIDDNKEKWGRVFVDDMDMQEALNVFAKGVVNKLGGYYTPKDERKCIPALRDKEDFPYILLFSIYYALEPDERCFDKLCDVIRG